MHNPNHLELIIHDYPNARHDDHDHHDGTVDDPDNENDIEKDDDGSGNLIEDGNSVEDGDDDGNGVDNENSDGNRIEDGVDEDNGVDKDNGNEDEDNMKMESDKAKMLLTGTMMRIKTAIKAKTMIFKDGKVIKPIFCSSGCPVDEDKKDDENGKNDDYQRWEDG